jgi:diacylglycerol kinase
MGGKAKFAKDIAHLIVIVAFVQAFMYLCSSRQAMRQPTRKETNFRWWNAAGIVVFACASLL